MKKKNSLLFLIIAIVTAGITLLFAPHSGKVTRKKLKGKANNMKDSFNANKENLVTDFKSSYFEAVDEVENEFDLLNTRQEQLQQTISSIEDELNHESYEEV